MQNHFLTCVWAAIFSVLFLFFGGCAQDSNKLIKQASLAPLIAAAAGFTGDFDVEAKIPNQFYLMEGIGSNGEFSIEMTGSIDPSRVSPEALAEIMKMVKDLTAIEELPEIPTEMDKDAPG